MATVAKATLTMSENGPVSTQADVDNSLLKTLSGAFDYHTKDSERLDKETLRRALGLRSEYLAERVLKYFDRDNDGIIQKTEFLEAIQTILAGTKRDKLQFAFSLHDHDSDGFIDRQEMRQMVTLTLAEDQIELTSRNIEKLIDSLFTYVDKNRDQRLSFEEFEQAVRRHPALLERMVRSEAQWICPNEDILERLNTPRKTLTARLGRLLNNRWLEGVWLSVWAMIQIVFIITALTATPKARGPGKGRGQPVATAIAPSDAPASTGQDATTEHDDHADTAAPMQPRGEEGPSTQTTLNKLGRAAATCVTFNGALIFLPMTRRFLAAIRARRIGRIIPVDSAITFHRIVGHAMFAFALLHTAAQVVSYYTKAPDAFLSQLLSRGMGQTGIALILVFAVMWVFSLSIVRRTKHFELFYFTHLLYFAWVILMVLHTPKYLIFAGIPLVLFFSELVWRIKRRRPLAKVLFADALRSGVTKLEIEKPAGFTYQAGDYVFVNVPQIANHEWHPFTLSSAPENPNLSIHIRSLGNWSSAIRSLVQRNPKPSDIKVHLDGPFGTPSARIFAARNVVLIGAGIGVTPFASVLESIYLKTVKRDQSSQHSLQKVHFFWINRDQYSFEWFRQLLTNIEHNDPSHVFEFNIFMTGAKSGGTALGFELAREAQRQAGKTDVITGLRATTVAGHPDWEKELTRIRDQHGQEKVEVFFCGPRGLGTKLRPLCRSLGLAFHEERF